MLRRLGPPAVSGCFRSQVSRQHPAAFCCKERCHRFTPDAKPEAPGSWRDRASLPKGLADEDAFPELAMVDQCGAHSARPIGEVVVFKAVLATQGRVREGRDCRRAIDERRLSKPQLSWRETEMTKENTRLPLQPFDLGLKALQSIGHSS